MGKTSTLSGRELAFAQGVFASYYKSRKIPPPREWAKREFAFALFGSDGKGPFVRHRSFRDLGDLIHAFETTVPRHMYYSTAFYNSPGHLSMKDKKWEGAEVIFDIDADHLRGAKGLTYPAQLDLAKKSFTYLLEEFIFGDFGISETDVDIVFSGGRGYHAHVNSPEFLTLGSSERRELVDYIMGVGFNMENAYFPVGDRTSQGRAKEFLRLNPPDSAGWRGRLSQGVVRWVAALDPLSQEEIMDKLFALLGGSPGVKNRTLKAQARSITRDLVKPEVRKAIVERLTLEGFTNPENRGVFLSAIARELSVSLQGETDAPVTTDVHRLIRMPYSLHGGTGFVVQPITRAELPGFDPVKDALAPTGNEASVGIEMLEDAIHPFRSTTIGGQAGDKIDVRESHALFLILRGEARLR